MRIYNTLTQKKEPFDTIEPGKAGIYVCGPTVYDYAHIGHARCYVVYDVLVRHLRNSGLEVTFVRGVTDVDDKIVNRAKENNEDAEVLATRFFAAYLNDMEKIGNLTPDVQPKVSEHIGEIVAMIQSLIDGGAAYESAGDVYFHVPKFSDYGKLSHRKLDDMLAGASGRTEADDASLKKHPSDFALWKSCSADEKSWTSPWGSGRPGWHIECSAMSMKYLGASFDLHGGGLDLVFPHHENEIAQSESASGQPYARTWMHNGFVQVNKEKMGKSLGNFFVMKEVFEHVEPEAMRYALLTMHYRGPFNLEWQNDDGGNLEGFPQFEEAERRLEYVYNTRQRLANLPEARIVDHISGETITPDIAEYQARCKAALDDDLNTPICLAHTSELLSAINQACDAALAKKGRISRAAVESANRALDHLAAVLGLGDDDPESFLTRIRDRRASKLGLKIADVESLISARNQARANKDYARSDAVREELTALGVEVLDSPSGTTWRLVSP